MRIEKVTKYMKLEELIEHIRTNKIVDRRYRSMNGSEIVIDKNGKLFTVNIHTMHDFPIEVEEEVKEDEKYYLRQMGVGSWSFLNFNINSQEYSIAGKRDDYTYKTQFTQSEIDDMPECYTHPAVWQKIKVGCED